MYDKYLITLGNKDFAAWDILTDSSYLGSPDTQMNTHLAQSGHIFPANLVFYDKFWDWRPNLVILKKHILFVAFMLLKKIVSMSRFQRKNRFEKRTNMARDIFKIVLRLGDPDQTAGWKQFLIDISSNIGCSYKPILALKLWNQDGCADYHKSHKQIEKKITKICPVPKK